MLSKFGRVNSGGTGSSVPLSVELRLQPTQSHTAPKLRRHAKERHPEVLSQQAAASDAEDPSTPAFGLGAEPASSPDGHTHGTTFEDDPPGHRSGFVAVVGRPNAGKSTLLNKLLGQQLSAVTEKAQTTRHRIVGIWSSKDHQAVILDTPGIIEHRRDNLEERMMRIVEEALRDADVVLVVVDASNRPERALEMLQPAEDWAGPPFIFVLNKIDLISDSRALNDLLEWFELNSGSAVSAIIPVSAMMGDGLEDLQGCVLQYLPEGPSMYPKDIIAEASERFFVSEIIRRHVFLQYREELPYQIAVQVVEFKERKPPQKSLIRAHIVVEKDRHRGILLGRKGSAIKALSMASRVEIEEFLEREVFLDLSVKVIRGWRKDSKKLDRLGY